MTTEYKGYNIVPLGTYSGFNIKAKGQGSVPNMLQGMYTTLTEAYKAIDTHYASLGKGRKNGKTEGSSSS